MLQTPMLAVDPGTVIVSSLLRQNLSGDGLGDVMDPGPARRRLAKHARRTAYH